ncbi:MAG: hypothetical protein K0Q50_206 [Vampirovibrio sp.]|nr:hypothetical protein [Vampirovibrio sp.]
MENPNLVQLDLSITLRDLFAGMAMQGMISNPTGNGPLSILGFSGDGNGANTAYEVADAMLKARKGEN